ncbi:MAG: hypothetical protein L0H70_09800 [Xanthomonadales bacterium]|nr:hypothetical protein [Xanthomonadales bacterium]
MTIAPFEYQFSAGGVGGKPPEILLLAIRARDADPDSPVKAWVFVRRVENYTYDDGTKNVRTASIELTYQAMNGLGHSRTFVGGSFGGSYDRYFGRISLTGCNATSRGGVLVPGSLRGLRLGTYLMNAVVGWAKQWPVATVNSIHVVTLDGTPDARAGQL